MRRANIDIVVGNETEAVEEGTGCVIVVTVERGGGGGDRDT